MKTKRTLVRFVTQHWKREKGEGVSATSGTDYSLRGRRKRGRGARTQQKKWGTAGWPSSLASSPHFSPSSPLRSLAIWSLKGHVKCLENDWSIKSDSVRPWKRSQDLGPSFLKIYGYFYTAYALLAFRTVSFSPTVLHSELFSPHLSFFWLPLWKYVDQYVERHFLASKGSRRPCNTTNLMNVPATLHL